MTIKTELIKGHIKDIILSQITEFEIDESKVADTRAVCALREIQEVLASGEQDDFLIVEEIVKIFMKYELDFGTCHDF